MQHTSRLRLTACCALLAACTGAAAETSPYYIGVSQTFTQRDNLFLLQDGEPVPDGASRSDLQSITSLLAGFDQPLGRGRVFGQGTVSANKFNDNSQLDSSSYSLSAGLDWESIERLSGSVKLGSGRNLRFDSVGRDNQRRAVRNVETTRDLQTIVRLGLITRLTAEAALSRGEIDYSRPESAYRQYRQNAGSLGLRYRPGGATTFGVGVRRTDSEYPQYFGPNDPDRFSRNDLDFNTDWAPGGNSSVNARLSYGKTSYDRAPSRNNTGVTGGITWTWQATGKLTLTSGLYRDTGQDSQFFTTRFLTGTRESLSAVSRSNTSLRTRADYALSPKISLSATAALAERELSNTLPDVLGNLVTQAGRDKEANATLGARWLPTRSVQLGCDVTYDRRSYNKNSALNSPFTASSYGCFGQFTLQ
jgi:hypothetical protein